jgi:shikimate kinase/3-dehydroquinate synthase
VSRKLVLVGFMGAGKSTAASRAAEFLGEQSADTDEILRRRFGTSIDAFFASEGEAAFRQEEEQVVVEALEPGGAAIVALGGGALGSERVRAALADHRVVYLDVDPEHAWQRVRRGDRPLARDRARFAQLHAEREPVYEASADVIVHAERLLSAEEWLSAARSLDDAPAHTRLLLASSRSGSYPVYVGNGLVETGFYPFEQRRFLVSDGIVARLYGDRLEPLAGRVSIMPGEQSKTIAHAEIVWTELARQGATREDHVVALGGGVVGDLAGFCAATYQRGVGVVQVPTTLVAQVDSAYGGKTGVDLPDAKNYVGAYHQPEAVLVDPATLHTLPQAERSAGYAEVLKTALIAGGRLWERVRGGAVDDELTVLACARTKLRVVAEDERDGGRRQVLNLGHTVAHAIESVTGYARYRHGEAVALGLLAALRLSEQPALREEVGELLAANGLPTRLEDASVDAVVTATERDKKRRGAAPVPFVLVAAPGDVRYGQPVPEPALRAAVEELTR